MKKVHLFVKIVQLIKRVDMWESAQIMSSFDMYFNLCCNKLRCIINPLIKNLTNPKPEFKVSFSKE